MSDLPSARLLLEMASRKLREAGVEDARRNAEWMLCDALGCDRIALFGYPERTVAPEQGCRLEQMINRRILGEPLQYIVGYTEFYGLRIRVTPDVLIPRPETELVVEHALASIRNTSAPRVLDVGTGSGCIALAVKHERPDAEVYACDVSQAALAVARANAEAHALAVRWLLADMLDPGFVQAVPGDLDLLISNPPYIPSSEAPSLPREVYDHEPHVALFAGEDPLSFYRVIVRHATSLVKPGGCLALEVHAHHAAGVHALVSEGGFKGVETRRDLADHPRMVLGYRPAG